MDANQFGVRAGCPVDKPRSPAADLAGGDARKARKRGVSFSLGYFSFGQAKEKYLALRRRTKALLCFSSLQNLSVPQPTQSEIANTHSSAP